VSGRFRAEDLFSGGYLDTTLQSGWTVEVAGASEPHWARLQKGAGHELLDMLNVVLDAARAELDVLAQRLRNSGACSTSSPTRSSTG
jgi:hypothetical protein